LKQGHIRGYLVQLCIKRMLILKTVAREDTPTKVPAAKTAI
jgi:hypothetical protein